MGIPIWQYPPLNQPVEQGSTTPPFKRITARCNTHTVVSTTSSSSSSSSTTNASLLPPPPPPPPPQQQQQQLRDQPRTRQHRTLSSRSYMSRLSEMAPSRTSHSTSAAVAASQATSRSIPDEIDYDDPQDLYDEIERATEQLIRARERAVRERQDRLDRPSSTSAASSLAAALPRFPADIAANVERYLYLGQEYHLPDMPRSTRRLPIPDGSGRQQHNHHGRRMHHVPQPDIQGQMLTLAEFLRETSAAVARRDEAERSNI